MKRNSTTLFLESPGSTTPLPWVDNEPDFTGFSEPTLSVLQAAWSAFLESGEPLEIVPDPVAPEPTLEPLWTAFNTALLTDPYWQSWAIPQDLRTAIIMAAVIGKGDTFQAAYDTAKAIVPLSGDAIASWQGLADQYHIPLVA